MGIAIRVFITIPTMASHVWHVPLLTVLSDKVLAVILLERSAQIQEICHAEFVIRGIIMIPTTDSHAWLVHLRRTVLSDKVLAIILPARSAQIQEISRVAIALRGITTIPTTDSRVTLALTVLSAKAQEIFPLEFLAQIQKMYPAAIARWGISMLPISVPFAQGVAPAAPPSRESERALQGWNAPLVRTGSVANATLGLFILLLPARLAQV